MARLMYRIANDEAPDLRSLRPELPGVLAEVVAKALRKNPAARPADGSEMGAALRAIDTAGTGPLWVSTMSNATGAQPLTHEAAAHVFESTVRLAHGETGHNSAP